MYRNKAVLSGVPRLSEMVISEGCGQMFRDKPSREQLTGPIYQHKFTLYGKAVTKSNCIRHVIII